MDTAAYLTRQGWRGSGHSLHPSGRGIAKPLLISQKNDVLGLGNRKNDALSDQWWLKAFDSTLKQVNLGAVDGIPKPVEKATSTLQRSFNSNALYSNFVKGEGLSGTRTSAIKPQTNMESIRQLDGLRNDGTVLESKEKGRDKNRNAHHAGEGPPLYLTIASSGSGALENEMTKDSQPKLKKKRAPEFSGEKGAAYLDTRPLVDGVEGTPRLKRKIEYETWETRNPESSEDKNLATSENGVLDSDPPRKRRRGRKGLNEASDIETSVSGGERGLVDAKMDSSYYELRKDSWLKPKMEEKSGKAGCQEEISGDEMNILSKLEEQLSIGNTTGQEEQAQPANKQDQRNQLGKRQQQLTKQEIPKDTQMRKKQRKLRRAKRAQQKAATLSRVADDISKAHGSASREWNTVRKERRRNRILGDDAGQPISSLPPTSPKRHRKNRMVRDSAGQPASSLPPMANHASRENLSASLEKGRARKPRRKNRTLGDDAAQPTSSLPPTANILLRGENSGLPRKKTKRLSVRPSGKHVDDPAKTSRPLPGVANDVPGQGKPALKKPRRMVGRNEEMFEYDDEPVATPMDAITQFLKSRAAK